MNMIPLGELVTIKGGGTPDKSIPAYWGGSIPWASVKDFKSTRLDKTIDSITADGVSNSATNVIPAGSIIVPTRMAVGKAAINTIDMAINQDLKALLPNGKVDTRYLLNALLAKSDVLKVQATGATVKGITLEVLRALEIPLPPLDEQRRIAAILDQADALRRKRQEASQAIKSLKQTVFVEMFGNPVANEKGWEIALIERLATKIGSGATPKGGESAYKSTGIPLVRSMNVHDGHFVDDGLAFIDDEQARKLDNVVVEEDDIFLNITGASVARVCRAPARVTGGRVNQHVSIIRASNGISSRFLEALLLHPSSKARLLKIGEAGATRQAITKAQIAQYAVIVPPLPLQNEFESRALAVEVTIENSTAYAKQLNALFAALQHRAFRGEL